VEDKRLANLMDGGMRELKGYDMRHGVRDSAMLTVLKKVFLVKKPVDFLWR
jgi:hypothetical protein